MNFRTKLAVASSLVVVTGLAWLLPTSAPSATNHDKLPVAHRVEQHPALAMSPALFEHPADAGIPPVADVATLHLAQPGETLGGIAAAMPGDDWTAYRNAIIDANPSLQANPDKLLAGTIYLIPAHSDLSPGTDAAPVQEILSQAIIAQQKNDSTVLRYTARAGDTLITMAQAFLGSGSQENQDAIVAANALLSADPDQVVAGRVYHIPAPDGLSAWAASASNGPTTRPAGSHLDADDVIARSAPRLLRYTARAGDNVSNLAIELLGSDTVEARDVIINSNPSLKANPDHVVAGQTYVIVAPTARTTP
jgi:hypothetical protein